MIFSQHYFLLLLNTNRYTTINAVTTNTASNPGTAGVGVGVGAGVGVAACAGIVGMGVDDTGEGVAAGTGVGDGVVRTGRTIFTVVVSLCDSPSSASTVYSPVKASEVLKVVWNLIFK
ncbi:MAG: hypothetical protein KAV25_07485 [Methanophagales archaeon]|nr:hypothetical protein [Methanophagales archaeon]